MKDITEIRSEIYDFAKDYDIFKTGFAEACFKITCATESSFLEMIVYDLQIRLQSGQAYGFPDIEAAQDSLRHAYREALKQARRFCKTDGGEVPATVEKSDIEKISAYLWELVDFNQTRNLFERCDLDRYSVEVVSDNEITFVRNKSARTVDADVYMRWIDKLKPELEERQLKNSAEALLYREMVNPENARFWEFKNKTFSKPAHLKAVYKLALDKVATDTEELGDYEIAGFTSANFKRIYSALVAIAVTNLNYHFVSRVHNQLELDILKPIAVFDRGELVEIIKSLTALPAEKIENVIARLTYDPEFHADKVTIFQPLFEASGKIFFAPSLVYFGLAYGKLLYLIKSSDENKQLISAVAREREQIMTDDLCEFIDEKSELLYTSNLTVAQKNGLALAEFDLILYDEAHKKMLLCELKWFFQGDGEADSEKLDNKLRRTINNRITQEKIAAEHLGEIKDNLGIDDGGIELRSCIVSKNYAGSEFLKDDLPVFDVFLFKNLLQDVNFDLEKLFKRIENKDYIPPMEKLGLAYVWKTATIAGYKINMESIGHKN